MSKYIAEKYLKREILGLENERKNMFFILYFLLLLSFKFGCKYVPTYDLYLKYTSMGKKLVFETHVANIFNSSTYS